MDYICLAFCNIHTCELAEELLRNFMLAMKQHALQVCLFLSLFFSPSISYYPLIILLSRALLVSAHLVSPSF